MSRDALSGKNSVQRMLEREVPSILYEHALGINMESMGWLEATPDVLALILVGEASFCTVAGLKRCLRWYFGHTNVMGSAKGKAKDYAKDVG
jgi:hypothetical protein